MPYKAIKTLIMIIPTLTIGLWEYVRHEYLLPYVPMSLGSLLSPLIVFAVSITLLRKLFAMMEHVQDQLNRERADKAVLLERERLARELHDGVAQSLFLLSVKTDHLERAHSDDRTAEEVRSLQKTVHQVNAYVRQAIAGLSIPPVAHTLPWIDSIENMAREVEKDTGIQVELDWQIPDDRLGAKEKVELFATLREALLNVRKHAHATKTWVEGKETRDGWVSTVKDNGRGFDPAASADGSRYGLSIMRERAEEMGWELEISRVDGLTVILIRKQVRQ
jgi:two-component system nitrate/nitrite sensor histidine kinase NarQ